MNAIEHSWPYLVLLFFFGLYPVISAAMWSTTALIYFFRREYHKPIEVPHEDDDSLPPVSILISCFCEEQYIAETIRGLLQLDYPDYEIVIVDDGSTDGTVEEVMPFVRRGQARLIAKAENEGKAMALNDAIPMLRGEIVLIMDADAFPVPEMLRFVVPHFKSARVAAVTGNPRVLDRDTLMAKLQVMEFTSIVSLQRRAQRIWGRILTVSGVVMAFRKDALIDVGLFSPDMATEDIDMTWKLQKRYYDIRYEPQALVWMRVPRTLRALWHQRRRWALGLAQVIRRHGPGVMRWERRRMWPILLESSLSIAWAYTFVFITVFFALSYAMGHDPVGGSPIPNWWGMTIATLALVQLAIGVLMDRRYDRDVARYYPVAVFYPIIYWMLMAVITALTTPKGLLSRSNRGKPTRWQTPRQPVAVAAAEPAPVAAEPSPAAVPQRV